jgi:hypothetical protein
MLARLLAWLASLLSSSSPAGETADQALLSAAEAGLLDDVRDALQRGADVAAETPVRHALAPAACARGVGPRVDVASAALRARFAGRLPRARAAPRSAVTRAARAPTHRAAQDGWTPLHYLAAQGCTAGVRLLLDANAPTCAGATSDRRTPLHWAARNGHADAVQALLRRGAGTLAADLDGCTALHLTAAQGCTDVARLLLEVGADVSARRKVRAAAGARVRPGSARR